MAEPAPGEMGFPPLAPLFSGKEEGERQAEGCGGLARTQRTGKSDCKMWENKSEERNAAGLWGRAGSPFAAMVSVQGTRGTRGVAFPRAGPQEEAADRGGFGFFRSEVFAGRVCQEDDTKCHGKSSGINSRITTQKWKVSTKHSSLTTKGFPV